MNVFIFSEFHQDEYGGDIVDASDTTYEGEGELKGENEEGESRCEDAETDG